MRALTNNEIIELWEFAGEMHPIDRVLAILQKVLKTYSRDDLAAIPLGSRDGLLLAQRRATFGDLIVCMGICQACGEKMELNCSCKTLLTDMEEPEHKTINQGGYRVQLRPLNSFDLAAAAVEETLEEAQTRLITNSIAKTDYRGQAIALDQLPQKIFSAIRQTAPTVDPHAEILLALTCADCNTPSEMVLDIGHIMWLEIVSRAKKLLMEVHVLAKNYGWAETEILKLSATRRSTYLQMVTA